MAVGTWQHACIFSLLHTISSGNISRLLFTLSLSNSSIIWHPANSPSEDEDEEEDDMVRVKELGSDEDDDEEDDDEEDAVDEKFIAVSKPTHLTFLLFDTINLQTFVQTNYYYCDSTPQTFSINYSTHIHRVFRRRSI